MIIVCENKYLLIQNNLSDTYNRNKFLLTILFPSYFERIEIFLLYNK